jgi:thioredoxin 1
MACLIVIGSPVMVLSEKSEVKWCSYQVGIEKMKKENKKGFIHFYTNWCTFCKLMNTNTFTDQKVIDYLNENFVPIRVNAEEQQDIAKTYNVNKFPNNFYIAEDISTIGNRPGYIPPDVLLDMLTYVHTNSYKTMTFNDFMVKKQAKKDSSLPENF